MAFPSLSAFEPPESEQIDQEVTMSKFAMNEHVRLAIDLPEDPPTPGGKSVRTPKRGAAGVIVAQVNVTGSPDTVYHVRITPWLDPFMVAESHLMTQAEYEQQETEMQVKGGDPRDDVWPENYRIDPASGRPYVTPDDE
jgi:hypothetical protein